MPKQYNLSSWLTSKKRGRDDDQIQRDRKKALAARKRFIQAKRQAYKKARKKYEDDEDDEDDDSIKDFVVDDDDDVEDEDQEFDEQALNDDESSSDEGSLELIDSPVPRKRTGTLSGFRDNKNILRGNDKHSKDHQVDEEESDEDATFFQAHKPRLSKPSKELRKASDAVKSRRLVALSAATQKKLPAPKVIDLVSASNRKVQSKPGPKSQLQKGSRLPLERPQQTRAQVPSTTSQKSDPGNDSDSSNSHMDLKPKFSKYFTSTDSKRQRNEVTVTPSEGSENDADEDLVPTKRNQTHRPLHESGTSRMRGTESLLETNVTKPISLDDTPPAARTKPTSTSTAAVPSGKLNMFSKFQNPILDDSDDDDDVKQPRNKSIRKLRVSRLKPAVKSTATSLELDDSSLDPDEEVALKQALKVSKKEAHKRQRAPFGGSNYDEKASLERAIKLSKKEATRSQNSTGMQNSDEDDDGEPIADESLLAETSDDEPEDRGDDYDEERQAATSVLHTAESLSAHVLKCMMEWTNHDDSNGKESAAQGAAQGMIVNGALSLGTLGNVDNKVDSSASSNKWISQKEMQQVCPAVKLSNYQLIGVNWMALLHGMKCDIEGKGTPVNGVLADEMGLGKTVQTIAFLAWLRHQKSNSAVDLTGRGKQNSEPMGPHLIVVPVSVLTNWMREFETFAPNLNVVKYHGSMNEREGIQEELRQYLPNGQSKGRKLDVILAPVTYFQKEKSDDRRFLNKFKFDYLVVDEAHMLKNSQSLRYKMLDKVSTRHRLLLTGTPVQNSPQELLNMLCFIMPLFSRGSDSMDETDNKGERMLLHFVDAEKEQSGDEQVAYKKLKHLFAPFVLRRKKEDVIAQLLPPKERIVEFVDLDANARSIYDSILADHVNKGSNKITAAIGENLFTNLRKAAHHPLLLRTRHNTPSEIEHLASSFHRFGAFQGEGSTLARVKEEVAKFNDFEIHLTALDLIETNQHRRPDLERYVLDESALFSSAKFMRLKSLLSRLIPEGHRVLIFSGWTSCLDLLGCLMENLGLEYLRMDGSCSSEDRQSLIDHFNQNNSINVFLLSTRACGIGINLTAADTCIIHDLDFNPFNDLQAEDRCHRIGQTRKVTVYKLVTQGTVDADIFHMQERKSKMNAAIMESNEAKKVRKDLLQNAVDTFLGSPKGKSGQKSRKAPVSKPEEEDDVICIL